MNGYHCQDFKTELGESRKATVYRCPPQGVELYKCGQLMVLLQWPLCHGDTPLAKWLVRIPYNPECWVRSPPGSLRLATPVVFTSVFNSFFSITTFLFSHIDCIPHFSIVTTSHLTSARLKLLGCRHHHQLKTITKGLTMTDALHLSTHGRC